MALLSYLKHEGEDNGIDTIRKENNACFIGSKNIDNALKVMYSMFQYPIYVIDLSL